MRFKESKWVWKINIFGNCVKVGSGKRNPFDYDRVKKMTRELIKKQKLEEKAKKNNYNSF